MRITNKVMQNNALSNINRNKELQDMLNTELSTGKKVNRPSDDPVVAIRALRLRSDVSQISQYSKKNIPDADSWLELTESSIKTTVSVVKDMIEQCEKGSNDTLTTGDRQIIIDELKALRDEVYATGNSDYAGRYIFTGYRTDTPLTFKEDTTQNYTITQIFTAEDITKENFVYTDDLLDVSEAKYQEAGNAKITEQDISSNEFYRIRLAYDGLDLTAAGSLNIRYLSEQEINLNTSGEREYTNTYSNVTVSVFPNNPAGGTFATKEEAYVAARQATEAGEDFAVTIPSTGEVIMSQKTYDTLQLAKLKVTDNTQTPSVISETPVNIEVTYNKSDWERGDLMPQHYFHTKTTDADGKEIQYNGEDRNGDGVPDVYVDGMADQPIEYQVGFDQEIRVNTTAGDIFRHDIGRDVDELIDLANTVNKVEKMREKLEKMKDDTGTYTDDERELIQKDYEAASKAAALYKDELQKRFSKYITKMQSYLDYTNEAITECGARSAKLQLISNRLDDQTTTFKTLQSENEDADATEVAVQLSSAKISYQAALMATSDMIQETLLNYL